MTTGGRGVRLTVRNGVTAIVMVAVAGVAGCGSPTHEPTPSTVAASPSPSTTLTAGATPSSEAITPPEMPAEMDRTDEVGAVAAARYFMESVGFATSTGELTEWNRFSGQTCSFCDNVRADVQAAVDEGQRQVGGELVALDDVRVVGVDEQLAIFGVQLKYEFSGGTMVDAAGKQVSAFDPQAGYIILDVVHSARGWVLLGGDNQDGPVQ